MLSPLVIPNPSQVAHAMRRQSSSLSSLGSILPGQEILSRHFALFKGVPGHLQFTRTEMFFSPVRGLRTISSRFWKRSSNPDVLKMPKHMDYPADVDKRITSSFRYSLDQIVSVKKESRLDIGVFDTEGLRMTFSDGSIFRLASVSKRDEAFSFILAHSAGPRSI